MKLIRPLAITDAILTSSNVPETDYAAYAAGTTYALSTPTVPVRVIVVSANVHHVYESIAASNIGNPPATSPTKWALVGATNRWKMLDASVSSQTTNASSISVQLSIAGSVADSVALMNINAASVTITQQTTDGTTYNLSQSLVSTAGIVDLYLYLTEPIVRKTDFVVTDLLPYANSTLTITLSDSGTVACGACVVGQKSEFGGTQFGAKIGIQDYSIKQKDGYGNYTILQRAFNKKGDFTFLVESTLVDHVQSTLANYRAKPIVYIGGGDYGSTTILGYYKDFSIDISYPTHSICSIQIEGLT